MLLAPLALDLGPQVSPRALWYPKKRHWLLETPRALVTDKTFWDHDIFTCMTHLGALGLLFTLGAPWSPKGPVTGMAREMDTARKGTSIPWEYRQAAPFNIFSPASYFFCVGRWGKQMEECKADLRTRLLL